MSNHLAIMKQPWFNLVKSGEKTIVSSISMKKPIPYQKVHRGDIIFLKRSGNFPINLQAYVTVVEYYDDPSQIEKELRLRKDEICIDEKFIQEKAKANYLCLFWITDVKEIEPISFYQRGQQAWIVDFIPHFWRRTCSKCIHYKHINSASEDDNCYAGMVEDSYITHGSAEDCPRFKGGIN